MNLSDNAPYTVLFIQQVDRACVVKAFEVKGVPLFMDTLHGLQALQKIEIACRHIQIQLTALTNLQDIALHGFDKSPKSDRVGSSVSSMSSYWALSEMFPQCTPHLR